MEYIENKMLIKICTSLLMDTRMLIKNYVGSSPFFILVKLTVVAVASSACRTCSARKSQKLK